MGGVTACEQYTRLEAGCEWQLSFCSNSSEVPSSHRKLVLLLHRLPADVLDGTGAYFEWLTQWFLHFAPMVASLGRCHSMNDS